MVARAKGRLLPGDNTDGNDIMRFWLHVPRTYYKDKHTVPNCGLESSTIGIAITLHSGKTENVLENRIFRAVDDRTRAVITMHTEHQRDTGVINQVMWHKYFIKQQPKQEEKMVLTGKGKDRYWIFYRHQMIWKNVCRKWLIRRGFRIKTPYLEINPFFLTNSLKQSTPQETTVSSGSHEITRNKWSTTSGRMRTMNTHSL